MDGKDKEIEDLLMQPGHRAYLWGILSYLFEYLGWFGKNQKGTKTMALQWFADSFLSFLVFVIYCFYANNLE